MLGNDHRSTTRNRAASVGEQAKKYAVVPDHQVRNRTERSSDLGVALFTCSVFAFSFALVLAISYAVLGGITTVGLTIAMIVAVLLAMSAHIAQEWERVVVLRLGAFNRVSGPGPFFTIPILEQNTLRVDLRTRVMTFGAEETLTSDLVPLDVDAVLFWMIYDPKAACLEVNDFGASVELAAQTALREAIGRLTAAQVAIKREQLDREIKEALADLVEPWGISVLNVEVRDILIPKELQDVMSLEAQAEQRMKSRLILAEGEKDISDMLVDASGEYAENEDALRLRAMHLLYESVRETGGTVVLPSSFAEGLGDVLPESARKM